MAPFLTLALCVTVGGLFGWLVPFDRVLAVSQPLSSFLSIIAAALLVRLNRTMPTVDWKSIDPDRREKLTSGIVFLTREYVIVLGIVVAVVASLIALTAIGDEVIFGLRSFLTSAQLTTGWPEPVRRALSGLLGFCFALVIVRMGHVVWRDYDIAKLQKAIIDSAAQREKHDEQVRISEEKISNITNSGLKSLRTGAPRNWDE